MAHAFILNEQFEQSQPDVRLKWFNPPQFWEIDKKDTSLVVYADVHTDFWQKTHYGFTPDNGHFLYLDVSGDFIMTTQVEFFPQHQYDQAGLMVRFSPQCWLKTSVEYEPEGASKLGVVVTNHDYSDWSTQPFVPFSNEITLRIRRENSDYMVEYLDCVSTWIQMRMAHLSEDTGDTLVQAGLYACSPIAAGFEACFHFLSVQTGRVETK